MAKITRLAGNLKAFASNAVGLERTVFGGVAQDDTLSGNIVTDFLRGWGIIGPTDIPTKQDFNALGFTSTQLSAYLHQAGVAEWDNAQEYYIGGVTNRNGILYTALTNNTNKAPESFIGVDWRYTALIESNTPSQAEAEAGTVTTVRAWSALRVKQAILALAPSPIPVGSKMLFAQAAAPTGWTQDTTDTADNRMLRVVSGVGAGIGGESDPIFPHVHLTGSHKLTVAEMPAHTHSYNRTAVVTSTGPLAIEDGPVNGTATSSPSGGDGYHNHGATGHAFTPKYLSLILCTKD